MEKYILENGVKLLYENRKSNITSFCIGFEAGAFAENISEVGIAHGLEHMVFKGTKNYSEDEINKLSDEIFGFSNAMTNYPYVIYYGTCLTKNFLRGFSLYSDIVLNPCFPDLGFKEEIDVIKQELKDWKDDPYQFCEDELLKNSFQNSRLKELIIGNENCIEKINIENLKKFYKENYRPDNCVISVVSSLEFQNVKDIVTNIFSNWRTKVPVKNYNAYYEVNKPGKYVSYNGNNCGAKVQYLFPIFKLSDEEIDTLKVFNYGFGEGTSSILYDLIRTKNGLAYDVKSYIKNEKGIKLYCIQLSTSSEKVKMAIELINNLLLDSSSVCSCFTNEYIDKIIGSIQLKNELRKEKSIEMCINLCRSEIMYGDGTKIFKDIVNHGIDKYEISKLVKKILINPSVQMLLPRQQ